MIGLSAILWTLVVGFFGILWMIVRRRSYWRTKGIPYKKNSPLLGIFFAMMIRRKSMAQQMMELYNACPGAKYFGTSDFGEKILVVKDPEILREIGVKSFAHFPNHQSFVDPEFDPLLAKNIFSLKDDRWREMRTVLTPAFTANKMKFMFQLILECATDFAQYLSEHSELTKEMDLKDVYTRYTSDVIATTAFGISVNSLKDRNNEFYVNGRSATSFEGFFKILKFLASRLFPKFMRLLGFTFLPGNTEKFFRTLVEGTIKIRDEKGIVRPDMIHLLMQARHNEHGVDLTNDDILAQAIIFFFAGFETAARSMCFISHVISHEPEIQSRLREEIDTVLSECDGNVTYDSMTRMKYLDMVLSETLRLYPPQIIIDRVCKEPYELPASTNNTKPFVVPSGTNIWVPVLGFHHDPNYFPEPLKFDPERFSPENKNDIVPYTYMPFGFGPRKCIGDRFALMETKLLIIQLLRRFVFEPSSKTTKHIEFAKNGTMLEPEKGFWMKLTPRKMQ